MSKQGTQLRQPTGIDARLSKLETHVESLADTVDRLASVVERVGKPNYSALGVAVSVGVALCSLAALAVFGPIRANESAIAEIKSELTHRIQREEDRNNRLEYKAGRTDMVDELFMAGKLILSEERK